MAGVAVPSSNSEAGILVSIIVEMLVSAVEILAALCKNKQLAKNSKTTEVDPDERR